MDPKKFKRPARGTLGRGLSALISSTSHAVAIEPVELAPEGPTPSVTTDESATTSEPAPNPASGVSFVELALIDNNPDQPRQEFKEEELKELADSIRTVGVLQPVLLRPRENGRYQVVAGERRWRAAKLAGLSSVPAIVHDLTDKETLEIALIENIQRSNLNPVEEARAYQRLMDEFALSQKDLADRVGKDRASVANYLRLLKLSQEVLDALIEGKLTMGHAKAILTIKEPAAQASLARKVIAEGLSVRALEQIVQRVVVLDNGRAPKRDEKSAGDGSSPFPTVLDRIRTTLGTKVAIKHHPSGKGKIEIEYFSEEELDRIVDTICVERL